MTSHYMILEVSWDGLWIVCFGLSKFHGHGSWLVCEVALRYTKPYRILKDSLYMEKPDRWSVSYLTP